MLSAEVLQSKVPSRLIADSLLKNSLLSPAHGFTSPLSCLFLPLLFLCFFFFLPSFFTKPRSKCSELEEELKNVTNNLKSLEAQAEKVGLLFQGPETFALLEGCVTAEHPLGWR